MRTPDHEKKKLPGKSPRPFFTETADGSFFPPLTTDLQSSFFSSIGTQAAGKGGNGLHNQIQRKKGEATEQLAGTLWAKDAAGKDLPPSLDDISQGTVGDCFLFAALAAIVNAQPAKIVGMIKPNDDGTYTVNFEGIGWFGTEQTVSADFLVGKHANVTSRKALWPLIIEKAYAKEKGGVDKVSEKGGNPGTAMEEILDEGVSRFNPRTKTNDYIMGKLKKALDEKWPITLTGPKKEGAAKAKKELADNTSGLFFNHSYAVIGIDSKKNRVKLFNPWGSDHPNGNGWVDVDLVRTFFIEVSIVD